ncbi:neutral zinc metallopeptidase [Actinophytocola xanthii]|uniref:Metalloprotease-like protein n=1 Tax=Actinophytocola xanthii TaxID=1912961 RepID=A0A1Q8CWA1_9PSEU|nr:neutral zinc metallopeptidase [Actinophytocola xanthii]OLF18633.1 metalloprotease-like protein [Actinophytocola xanthii]
MRTRLPAAVRLVAPVLLLVASLAACTNAIAGEPVSTGSVLSETNPDQPGGIDPSFVKNTDGGPIDQLAAAVLTDVRSYWTETFPATFDGKEWEDLSGGYYSVDTSSDDAPAPPCVQQASDVEGNAFYCPSEDVIAWDRAALLPVLKERFGEAAVMLVLAHEMGHAVQRRAGLTPDEQRANPERYPTILIEAQADCYAGAFVRWVADGKAAHLQVADDRLDAALESLITFRDPVGTEQTDEGAHGDSFDRVSAFQDGYGSGATLCADISIDNRTFTQRGFRSAADAERGGNLPFDQLVTSITEDLTAYFATVVREQGGTWTDPTLTSGEAAAECAGSEQGPIAFCAEGDAIEVTAEEELPKLHTEIGDYATGILLASRYGMATLDALGKPLEGERAQRQLLCLSGSYTGTLLARTEGFTLSPGDLDEAIQVLLRYDYPGRDTAGEAIDTGYERVSVFRKGTLEGPAACELT